MSCDAKCSAYERPRSYKNMVKRFVFEHECTPPEWIAVSSPTDSVLYQTTAREKKSLRGMCFPYVLSAPHWKHDNAEKWVVLLSLSLFLSFSVFLFHVIYLQVFVPELKQCKTRQLLVFRLTVVGNLSASVTKASKNCFTNPSICRMPKDTAANCVQYRRDWLTDCLHCLSGTGSRCAGRSVFYQPWWRSAPVGASSKAISLLSTLEAWSKVGPICTCQPSRRLYWKGVTRRQRVLCCGISSYKFIDSYLFT